MALQQTTDASCPSTEATPLESPLRVLALHGSGETAPEFTNRVLGMIQKAMPQVTLAQLDITSVQAPHPKGDGYAWWNMQEGERSYTAKAYGGYDESAARVLDAYQQRIARQDPPFDLVVGHSQGAILMASLLVDTTQEGRPQVPYHPARGYILNGVAFPNPFTAQAEALTLEACYDAEGRLPRILVVMGTNDPITPNATGEQLRDTFQQLGLSVQTVQHPGGHGFPMRDQGALDSIANWIVQKQ
eukprot:Nitzschia sp. Nitz4//scaffold29_size155292//80677//81411//NITZ4_002665-RA/size155292-processed-gene-0.253-mRNA-1//1//CDS//3329546469//5953//frame0